MVNARFDSTRAPQVRNSTFLFLLCPYYEGTASTLFLLFQLPLSPSPYSRCSDGIYESSSETLGPLWNSGLCNRRAPVSVLHPGLRSCFAAGKAPRGQGIMTSRGDPFSHQMCANRYLVHSIGPASSSGALITILIPALKDHPASGYLSPPR